MNTWIRHNAVGLVTLGMVAFGGYASYKVFISEVNGKFVQLSVTEKLAIKNSERLYMLEAQGLLDKQAQVTVKELLGGVESLLTQNVEALRDLKTANEVQRNDYKNMSEKVTILRDDLSLVKRKVGL